MHFSSNRLGPSLDGKLPSVIVGVAGKGAHTSERRNVEDDASAMVFVLTHDLDSLHSHAGGAKEQGLHLIVGLLFCG